MYNPGDLFSAISSFSYEFGEYLSREMAAKHPGISTVGFTIPSVYMATIALSGIGVAPHTMQMIYTTLSKLLSIEGKLINPDKITEAFRHVDDAWLWLTKCQGTVETAIMTSFGGPKLIYLVTEQVNKMVSGIPQTTITEMARLFSAGNLDTQLTSDKVREKLKTFLKTTIML